MPDRSPVRRARFLVSALIAAVALPAAAQYPSGATVQRLPQPDDPSELLAAALRTLSISPNDLPALVAAGRNALALGDPNAAAGFFGRADTISPRDGRVKAGLGSTLVQLGKPQDALRMFAQASALGVPDTDLAEDRGLAYDLSGDTVRAQADYRRVLTAQPDDDAARRRLALSQGIAGDRKGAIATLDPLIRKRDIAAWRAQTFVLAMTGDPQGANDITRIMLPTQSAALQPFLVRLSSLTPAEKARAVHFGEMPAQRSYAETQLASTGPTPTYAPPPASRPTYTAPVRQPAPQTVIARPVATQPAPNPAASTTLTASAAATQVAAASTPVRVAAVTPQAAGPGLAYRDAPLAQTALTPAASVANAGVASPSVPNPGVATARVETAIAKPAVTVPEAAANTPPSVATALPMPMPVGADAASGHFDIPSATTVRRPVPRAVQPTARPAVATPAPAEVRSAEVSAPAADTPTPGVVAPATTTIETVRPEPARVAAATPARSEPREPTPRPATHARTTTRAVSPVDDTAELEPVAAKPSRARRGADARPTRLAALDRSEDDVVPSRGKDRSAAKDEEAGATRGRPGRTAKSRDDDAADAKPSRRGKSESDDSRPGRKGREDADDAKPSRKGKTETADAKSTRKGKADAKESGAKGSGARDADAKASRVFVQVAGGANKADMDKAWGSVKKQAPDLMKGKAPSTTPLRATNRLLVGPFKDEDEAQAFVNKMAGKGMSGFVFKSAKGQKVEKIDGAK